MISSNPLKSPFQPSEAHALIDAFETACAQLALDSPEDRNRLAILILAAMTDGHSDDALIDNAIQRYRLQGVETLRPSPHLTSDAQLSPN